ncbi:MAG: exodeoxyribonuclease V beta subunit, partial [Myxococcota bacterium]
ATLFLIGDPKQAIYGFRGADVIAYLDARDDAQESYTLSVNWRSDPGLLRGIAALFAPHPAPFLDPRITFVDVDPAPAATERLIGPGAPVELVLVPRRPRWVETWRSPLLSTAFRDDHYPKCVAAEVVRLLHSDTLLTTKEAPEGRPVRPGDVAVLVRTNKQARALHRELQARGVPAALQGDASVLESPEARDAEALLAALADPGDRGAVRGALVSRVIGLDAHDLLDAQQDEATWEAWSGRMHRWAAIQLRHGFLQAFRTVLAERDVPRRLLGQEGGERVLTNLLHLSELLQQVATEQRLGTAGLLHWLRRAREGQREGLDADAGQLRLESDSGAVELVTVHRSKGLEYPIVLVPHLWSGVWVSERDPVLRFHDPAAGGQLTLDLGGPDRAANLERARAEELAENLRLLYVALTRAKHRAIVFWGAFRGFDSSALAWLLHPPAGPPEDPVGWLQSALADMRDTDLRDALDTVAGRSPDVAVRVLPDDADVRWVSSAEPVAPREARTPTRTDLRARRIGSYSALVRGAPHTDTPVDHDAGVEVVFGAGEGPVVPMAEFPRGAGPGTALHAVLEVLDFQVPPEPVSVGAMLTRHGVDPEWGPLAAEALGHVLATPLGDGAPALAEVPRSHRLDELEFVITVDGGLTAAALAEPFRRHGGRFVASTADRLAELGFPPLEGFLRGVVDLVFAHEGRWWLVDYKSNHLGDRAGDYRGDALRESMAHHHYVLQYHLYLVALHRYLGRRLRGYDYDRDVGGARYLFLRGMDPERPGSGVYADRPSRELVEALDAVLSGAGG